MEENHTLSMGSSVSPWVPLSRLGSMKMTALPECQMTHGNRTSGVEFAPWLTTKNISSQTDWPKCSWK